MNPFETKKNLTWDSKNVVYVIKENIEIGKKII